MEFARCRNGLCVLIAKPPQSCRLKSTAFPTLIGACTQMGLNQREQEKRGRGAKKMEREREKKRYVAAIPTKKSTNSKFEASGNH